MGLTIFDLMSTFVVITCCKTAITLYKYTSMIGFYHATFDVHVTRGGMFCRAPRVAGEWFRVCGGADSKALGNVEAAETELALTLL